MDSAPTIVDRANREQKRRPIPTGSAQLIVDGVNTGAAVALDSKGKAMWSLTTLTAGTHQIRVRYTPTTGSVYLTSLSLPLSHVVH